MITTKRHGETTRHGDPDTLAATIAAVTGTSREQVGVVRRDMGHRRYLPGEMGHTIAVCWRLLEAVGLCQKP